MSDKPYTLHLGDCLDVLKTLPDNSVDSVVTDPPYGLSKQPDMAEVMRHWLAGDDYSGAPKEGKHNCASYLARGLAAGENAHDVEADAAQELVSIPVHVNPVPVRTIPVKLDNGRLTWKVEIDRDGSAICDERLLVDKRHSELFKLLDHGKFYLRKIKGHSPCVGQCTCCSEGANTVRAVLVRIRYDALCGSNRAAGVMAFSGTEMTAVLTFDLARRSAELRPASGANKLDAGLDLVCAEGIGALPRAGGLPAVTEPNLVGQVGDATHRTFTFNLAAHKKLLARLKNPTIANFGFMGKGWDSFVPGPSVWRECLRVLKPGGHLLAFFGSRTYDMGTLAVRLAGFEIRDQVMWISGSGFPKSQNVSKAIDKAAGAEREVIGELKRFDGKPAGQVKKMNGGALLNKKDREGGIATVTAPATDAARQWDGWGTALKPSFEPIVVARKPLEGTVAANVLAHGTGALNIDGCRVKPTGESRQRDGEASQERRYIDNGGTNFAATPGVRGGDPSGRWPANVIHDGSDEVLAAFPDAKGQQGDLKATGKSRPSSGRFGDMAPPHEHRKRIDSTQSAARFFYAAKASRKDRNEGLTDPGPQFQHGNTLRKVENAATKGNIHPTVKPTDLMAYLLRLVTPPGGTALDPFMGSGSTGKAAMRERFRFIGIEREPEYLAIAEARIAHELAKSDAPVQQEEPENLDLFGTSDA